ncbi:MAG: hypothetical protein HY735_05710 [Verrucomicrobia bacterium]|nr:hypothetical protein [Verrucomicrobiota bacterium]
MRRLIWNLILGAATSTGWASVPVPDFHLTDTNPNSERNSVRVSPRDYLLQVSGYYFGAAG